MLTKEIGMDKLFHANAETCTGCGLCVRDCVAGVITLENGVAVVPEENADGCCGCQHCLAICPNASVSLGGLEPADSASLTGFVPDASNFALLVRGRRSIRQFRPEPVPLPLLERILSLTSYAPTGVNARCRRFTVLRDSKLMELFRERFYRYLVRSEEDMPEECSWLAGLAADFLDNGKDDIFRNAPHMLVVSVADDVPCADVDAVIAASYFDLAAQANGVGTLWAGMVYAAMQVLPEPRKWLGIPEDHRIGYVMLFGLPAVAYARTAQYSAESVAILSELH